MPLQISNAISPAQRAVLATLCDGSTAVTQVRTSPTESQSGRATGSTVSKRNKELESENAWLRAELECRRRNESIATTSVVASPDKLGDQAKQHIKLTQNARSVMELDEMLRNAHESSRRMDETLRRTPNPSGGGGAINAQNTSRGKHEFGRTSSVTQPAAGKRIGTEDAPTRGRSSAARAGDGAARARRSATGSRKEAPGGCTTRGRKTKKNKEVPARRVKEEDGG